MLGEDSPPGIVGQQWPAAVAGKCELVQIARRVVVLDSFAMNGHAARIQAIQGRSKSIGPGCSGGVPSEVQPLVVAMLAAVIGVAESCPASHWLGRLAWQSMTKWQRAYSILASGTPFKSCLTVPPRRVDPAPARARSRTPPLLPTRTPAHPRSAGLRRTLTRSKSRIRKRVRRTSTIRIVACNPATF